MGKFRDGNEFKIIEVIDDKSFRIDINFEPKITLGKIFINGLKVDDFKSLDYNQITNTQGIKELYNKIKELEERLMMIESKS